MQKIYQNAETVVVFIGDGRHHRVEQSDLNYPPTSPRRMFHGDARDEPFLAGFQETFCNITRKKLPSLAALLTMSLVRLLADESKLDKTYSMLMSMDHRVRQELFELLRIFVVSPWWKRIWVVQEIAVSSAAVVQYGSVVVPWAVLERAAKAMSRGHNSNLEPEHQNVLTRLATQLSSLEQTRRRWRAEGGIQLIRLLQEFSDRKASDDRDKVYGLLSLAKQGHLVMPDYSHDVFETYRSTALSLIRADASLSCWAGDQMRKSHKTLPSWVPDWSTAFDQADKRRMDRTGKLQSDSAWKVRVIEKEVDYWLAVEEQMRELLDSLEMRPTEQRTLPASLRQHVIMFQGYVIFRYMTPDGDLFQLRRWIADISRHCERHDIVPSSGRGFASIWLHVFSDPLSLEHAYPRFWTAYAILLELRMILERLDHSHNMDHGVEKGNALRLIEYIDSLCTIFLNFSKWTNTQGDVAFPSQKILIFTHMHPWITPTAFHYEREAERPGINSELGLAFEQLIPQCRRLAFFCTSSERARLRSPKLAGCSYIHAFHEDGVEGGGCDSPVRYPEATASDWFASVATIPPRKRFISPENVLYMRGIRLGCVKYVGQRFFGWSDKEAARRTLSSWISLWLVEQLGKVDLKKSQRYLLRPFARTILGGAYGIYGSGGGDGLDALISWLINLVALLDNGGLPLTSQLSAYLCSPFPLMYEVELATDGRVFFVTDTGEMGLGPASTQPGDTIHVFPGGRTNFVVRRLADQRRVKISRMNRSFDEPLPEYFNAHELVGDCYLDSERPVRILAHGGQLSSDDEPTTLKGSLPFEFLVDSSSVFANFRNSQAITIV